MSRFDSLRKILVENLEAQDNDEDDPKAPLIEKVKACNSYGGLRDLFDGSADASILADSVHEFFDER